MNETKCLACKASLAEGSAAIPFFPSSLHYPTNFDHLKIIYCKQCGFSTTDQPIPGPLLDEYYEKHYIGKAFKLRSLKSMKDFGQTWFDVRSASQFNLIEKFLDLRKVEDYYEIGPGEGAALVTLKKLYPAIKLFISEPQTFKKTLFKEMEINFVDNVLTGNQRNKYDLVFMSHSLEHFNGQDIPAVLTKIFNSLRDGGAFFCEIPNADLLKYPLAGETVVPHLSFFSRESIQKFFEDVGFTVMFNSCAGDDQRSKKIDDETRKHLESIGVFNFKIDETGRFKINQKLLEYQHHSNRTRSFKEALANLPFLVDVKRKFKFKGPLSVLQDNHFKYSEDREFIRILGIKKKK